MIELRNDYCSLQRGKGKGVFMKKLILSTLVLALSTSVIANTKSTKVIYGDDNRVDVYASNNNDFVELSKSTAAMIANNKLTKTSNGFKIEAGTLEARGICKSERFSQQPSAANCSGFLVGDKYLVTAGHCIKSQRDCNASSWVFNFKMNNATEANMEVATSDVYKCKKIISQSLDNRTKDDYALIELDRVADRAPLKFRRSGKIKKGTELVVIGHPSGIPTKISDGATVRSIHRSKVYFYSNLDTYGGNSGSAVFNVATGEVEGILVRGATDYVRSGSCKVSNRISDRSGTGEGVTIITNIKKLMKL